MTAARSLGGLSRPRRCPCGQYQGSSIGVLRSECLLSGHERLPSKRHRVCLPWVPRAIRNTLEAPALNSRFRFARPVLRLRRLWLLGPLQARRSFGVSAGRRQVLRGSGLRREPAAATAPGGAWRPRGLHAAERDGQGGERARAGAAAPGGRDAAAERGALPQGGLGSSARGGGPKWLRFGCRKGRLEA